MADAATKHRVRPRRAEWAPLRRPGPPTIAVSKRHTRFVGMMKLVLPAIAAALIAIVLVWPGAIDRGKSLPLSFAAPQSGPADALAMVNPRYLGTDSNGLPFMITAATAVQDPGDLRRITLTDLQADMTLSGGTWLSLMAQGGLYHQGHKTLQLAGPVSVYSDRGYEFHAGDVAVDLDKGSASSDSAVSGQGPFGEFRADRMRILKRGRHLLFDDNVVVTLHPGRDR